MDKRGKTIFLGIVIGAGTGLFAALLLNRRALKDERSSALTTGEGLKIGVMVFGLLRAISSLGDDEKSR